MNYTFRHEKLVMVSGGSSITPFISIIRELIYVSTIYKCKTPQITLICSFKNSSIYGFVFKLLFDVDVFVGNTLLLVYSNCDGC